MRILKHIIFISILSGIFVLIYRQSDEKGFRRWWMSFKPAVLTAAIAAGLIPFNTEAIESPGNNNQIYQERLLSDQEFNLYENTDQQVILARRDSSGTPSPSNIGRQGQSPSNFPTSPSGGRRPSWPITGINPYRHLHVNPGTAGNPGGAGNGGAANYNDESGIPKIPQELKTYDYDYRSNLKKKESAEQCELDENVKDVKVEIVYRIKENSALVREAERMGKDQAAQKDVNNLIEQLSLGNDNPGIGSRRVKCLKNVSEARGRNEGRVYFREKDGKIEILAKSNKDNQNKVIAFLQKMGY
jgi:hypothetical protein